MTDNGLNWNTLLDQNAYLEATNRYLMRRNAKLTAACQALRGMTTNPNVLRYLDGVLDTSQDTQPIMPIERKVG
jgi:hypothetical protein